MDKALAGTKLQQSQKGVQAYSDVSRAELYKEDIWPEPFRHARTTAPVCRVETSDYGPYWSISSYQAIVEIEALPEVYSSEKEGILIIDPPVRFPSFIARDRPVHTTQRRTVSPIFTPSHMAQMASAIRHRTTEILDSLPSGEPFDWVDTVSIELTTQMLAVLFDFPWEDRHKLTLWSDWAGNIEMMKTEDLRQKRIAHIYECGAYFRELWQERAKKPPSIDLLSMMIHSDVMSNMDEQEFIGNLLLLIVGGNDTTRNSMSAAAYGFDLFPDQRAKLQADPSLIANATQEIFRWQTPVIHMRRTAVTDTHIMGQDIKAGEKVVLWYISGNRDEAVFGSNADELVIDRKNARRHLSFGHGIHRCVGARLAELQMEILLNEMLKRRMRVNVVGPPVRTESCFIRGFKSLPVEISRI